MIRAQILTLISILIAGTAAACSSSDSGSVATGEPAFQNCSEIADPISTTQRVNVTTVSSECMGKVLGGATVVFDGTATDFDLTKLDQVSDPTETGTVFEVAPQMSSIVVRLVQSTPSSYHLVVGTTPQAVDAAIAEL